MEEKQQQVMTLIDSLGSSMSKEAWVCFLENISSDCDIRAEAAREELENED